MSGSSYYVPHESKWPIIAATAMFAMILGTALMITSSAEDSGILPQIIFTGGALGVAYFMFGWFSNVIKEAQQGLNSAQLDRSYRMGMMWFIFSEVMFFAAFFGALFYVREFAIPWLGGEGEKGSSNMLWPEFAPEWPLLLTPDMTKFAMPEKVIDPWTIPFLNTVLLVTSSFTLTFAHDFLKRENRPHAIMWLAVTIGLGVIFLALQVYEYYEAYVHLGLTLNSGIYGSTFFMLTGFHGAHVTIGTIMLIVMLFRMIKGHFTEEKHFGFEAAAWYWHFVDVVWLFLFVFVYVF